MHFSQRTLIVAVAVLAMLASTGAAIAHGYDGGPTNTVFPASRGYGGNWPVTITHSRYDNGTDCLTLNGGGRNGVASLVAGGTKYPDGSFLILNGILVVNIVQPLGDGSNGALMFIAHASRGNVGPGVFEDIETGYIFDAGDLTFGMKNGC